MLLKGNRRLNMPFEDGKTALMLAIESENAVYVDAILECNQDCGLEVENQNNLTALQIAIIYAGYPEKLGAAATTAKSLGMNLSDVDKIADSLLNFEQSIIIMERSQH